METTQTTNLLVYLWPVVSAGLIVPIVSWIKKKLPTDFPIQQPFISALLSIGTVYLMNLVLGTGYTMETLVSIALGIQVGTQMIHGVKKTYQESKKLNPLG